MPIQLKLNGFGDFLEKIQNAGGSVDKEAEKCIKKSAQIFESDLKVQMQKSKVPNHLIDSMPKYEYKHTANSYSVRVGYKMGSYNPDDLSDGYKVLFLNYGTPHREEHGKISARGFIQKAKRNANKKIKKEQEKALNDIVEELE